MKKIILAIGILALLLGTVYAADINALKTPKNCTQLKDGCASYTNHVDRMFYVEKATGDYKADWFTNSSDFLVENAGDNIYLYHDDTLKSYGCEEIVNIDGEEYMVSTDQGSDMSPNEVKMLLESMKEFNKLNNLEPVEI